MFSSYPKRFRFLLLTLKQKLWCGWGAVASGFYRSKWFLLCSLEQCSYNLNARWSIVVSVGWILLSNSFVVNFNRTIPDIPTQNIEMWLPKQNKSSFCYPSATQFLSVKALDYTYCLKLASNIVPNVSLETIRVTDTSPLCLRAWRGQYLWNAPVINYEPLPVARVTLKSRSRLLWFLRPFWARIRGYCWTG